MPHAGVPQRVAVRSDRHRPVDHVLTAVSVQVGDGQAVRALPPVLRTLDVGVEDPPGREVLTVEVHGPDHRARVVAAREDHRGRGPVEVRRARQEPVDPVAVVVAPAGHVAARGLVVDGVDRSAGAPVEDGQVLRSRQDVAAAVAVVGARVPDDDAPAVARAVGGLHGDLGVAVTVVVVHLELGVVGPGPDVAPQVDPPQAGSLERVGVDDGVVGDAGLRVVLGVGRVPLDDVLVVTVTVQVGDGGVVGLVRARGPTDRDVEVAAGTEPGLCARARTLGAVGDGRDGVGPATVGVEVVRGAGDRRRVELLAVAVDVEGHVLAVGAQQAPADQVAAPRRHDGHAAGQGLDLVGAVAARFLGATGRDVQVVDVRQALRAGGSQTDGVDAGVELSGDGLGRPARPGTGGVERRGPHRGSVHDDLARPACRCAVGIAECQRRRARRGGVDPELDRGSDSIIGVAEPAARVPGMVGLDQATADGRCGLGLVAHRGRVCGVQRDDARRDDGEAREPGRERRSGTSSPCH